VSYGKKDNTRKVDNQDGATTARKEGRSQSGPRLSLFTVWVEKKLESIKASKKYQHRKFGL